MRVRVAWKQKYLSLSIALHFRIGLTNRVKTFVVDFESLSNSKKVEILLHGHSWCDGNESNYILSASINYVKKTKRFDCSLFD